VHFPDIIAYVFFKSPTAVKANKNLSVGVVYSDKRFIALNVTAMVDGEISDTIFAGSKGKPAKDEEQQFVSLYKEDILWLDEKSGNPEFVEVVLCEGPCRDISNFPTKKKGTNRRDEVAPAPDTWAEIANLQTEIAELKTMLSSKLHNTRKNAIAAFMDSKTVFKFVDSGGNELELSRKDLITKECTLPKIEQMLALKGPSEFIYNQCVSVNTNTNYKVVNAKIQLVGKNLTVIYTLKKTKPDKITEIEVPVEMVDGYKVTTACTLQAKIVGPTTNDIVPIGTFTSNILEPVLSLKLDQPITWRGKTLVLEKAELEGVDCQPEGGKYSVSLTPQDITDDGVLKLQKRVVLDSTLGKALLVLNTMIGVKSSNASDSSIKFYPIADNEPSRELFIEMINRTLEQLKAKFRGLKVGLRQHNGKLTFKDFTDYLENHSEIETARSIVGSASFSENEFKWDSMIRTINQFAPNPTAYAYWIFIGQSGLLNDKSYCKNIPSEQEPLDQGVATIIYDFAASANVDSPVLAELPDYLRAFPATLCDDIGRHVVFFPKARKPGWKETISNLLSEAIKVH
jgi:hypothetical protein